MARLGHFRGSVLVVGLMACAAGTDETVVGDGGGVDHMAADARGDVETLDGDAKNPMDATADDTPAVVSPETSVADLVAVTEVPCPAGQSACEGACVDTRTSTTHCGACGQPCATLSMSTASCVAGRCASACVAGFGDCDAMSFNGCETNLADAMSHCGACGRVCPALANGESRCEQGSCVTRCPTGRTACSATCADLLTDGAHCGACGRACEGGLRCTSGRCLGPQGYRAVRDDAGATWVDACALPGHETLIVNSDEGTARLRLPFAFRFWGVPLAEGAPVIVTANGYLTFMDSAPTPPDGIIPNAADRVNAVIAAQWRNLRTRGPGVCVALVGNAAGSRRWVVQWSDARYFTTDLARLNFEVALNEGTHTIDLVYGAMTLPEPSTVALENWEGTRGAVPFGIPQPIVFSNSRARFYPE